MKHIEVNVVKLVPEAVVPSYAKNGDAGLDLTATSMTETELYIEYGTGLAFEIPPGYFGDMRPRSSISNYNLILSNSPGTVDSGYRGEVKFRFKKTKEPTQSYVDEDGDIGCLFTNAKYYKVGDRIGQMVIQAYPLVTLNVVDELESTTRGNGGFGSSGK
jgi:dUTP pyrophosphatase